MIIKLVEGIQAVCSNCTIEESARKASAQTTDYDTHGYYLVKMTHTELVLCRECFQVMSDMWVYDLDCGNRRIKKGDVASRVDLQMD